MYGGKLKGTMRTLTLSIVFICLSLSLKAQTGSIRGTVTLATNGDPLHHARVLLLPLGKSVDTDELGKYEFTNVAPGKYEIVAHMMALTDTRQRVEVTAGSTVPANFTMSLGAIKQELTVTASGKQETPLEAFSSTSSLDSLDLAAKAATSLGDVLDKETGVNKRSYGPGNSRPVIRGFDGDRVLVMQDGMPTGTLSSQSGDHGEPVDPASLERVEVVRGPATLLYGTSALGGVVNMITGHHEMHHEPHQGASGYITGIGGTNNGLGGLSGGLEYGVRKWVFHLQTGGQRTGDYSSATQKILNSGSNNVGGSGGLAKYSEKTFFHASYNTQQGTYYIPFDPSDPDAEKPSIEFRRHNVRFGGGLRNLASGLDGLNYSVNYSDWNHKEVVNNVIGTEFFNKSLTYRSVFDQRKKQALSGSFGFAGMHRDYKIEGTEKLAPNTTQNQFAVFAVESLTFDKVKFQFGGRIENNQFHPETGKPRSFTGFSGAAGISVPVWNGGALVGNYSHSYRSPALEELYNLGPHAGNQTYEIGASNLTRERGDGVDVSLRHQANKVRAELNTFHYSFENFVFLAPTGAIQNGLIVARYSQASSRYQGAEARLALALNSALWLNLGFDAVDAKIKQGSISLPRIPPLRGRIGVDYRRKGFSLSPELLLSNKQDKIFTTETPTAGFVLFNVKASYVIAQAHTLHQFGVNFFNTGNVLNRNHLSFIKEFAPEIGRGMQVSYTMRFF